MSDLPLGTPFQLTTGSFTSPVLNATHLPNGAHVLGVVGATGNLRIRSDGTVDDQGNRGLWAQFLVLPERDTIRLQSVGHAQKHGRTLYLEADAEGALKGSTSGSFFAVLPASDDDEHECEAEEPRFELSDEQRATFVRDGVLVLPGLVPRPLVDDALRTVNHRLGLGSAAWERDAESGKEKLSGVSRDPAIDALLNRSPAVAAARALLGPRLRGGRAGSDDAGGGQVALRFPMAPQRALQRGPKSEEQWHIDGMMRQVHMSPFQLLVGVALSAQPDDDCGNLHVWPAQHAATHEAVRTMRAMRAAVVQHAPDADDADDADNGLWLGQRPALPADGFVQMRLQPGDVVLAHQKTPHRIGLNRSPHVRYQVYFRLSAADHVPHAELGGLFDGWHGLHAAAEAATRRDDEQMADVA